MGDGAPTSGGTTAAGNLKSSEQRDKTVQRDIYMGCLRQNIPECDDDGLVGVPPRLLS